MYLSLIQNAALLVALSTLCGLLARLRREGSVWTVLVSGLLFGGMAVAAMLLPFRYEPGIIYDGRSIILTLAGLFVGGPGSAIAIVVAGAYRAYMGGAGVWAGLATIVICPLIGMAFRRAWRGRPENVPIPYLYLLGLISHGAMLACQLLIPWPTSVTVISRIWLPVVIVFPFVTALIGVFLGSEERRIQTARELRESNERFRSLTSQLDAVVWTASEDGRTIRDVNQAFETIYGAPAEAFRADADLWLDLVHPDDRHSAERSSQDLSESGHSQAEYRIVRPDGSVRWLRDRRSMIYDEKQRPTGMGGLVVDITEAKGVELERERLQAQTLQSQKMEAVGRLAGGIAHDFNNLLTVINNYASLVLSELRSGDALREDVTAILDAGRRAADLTRQLLAFSRRQVMEPEILDMNEAVAEMERMLARLIGEHIDLRTVPAPDLWKVSADPAQIQQVLMNLVVNARDAMPDGGVILVETANVEVREEEAREDPTVEAGSYVLLTVSDTGCGMGEETRLKVFEPFFTTKDKGAGTGLGLSTVFGIVKQSGGHIVVRSDPGKGTTFSVYLPRAADGLNSAGAGPRPEGLGGNERVLLVEDERPVRDLTARILEQAGYRVCAAESGEAALSLFEREAPDIDLLLTDIVMPHITGTDLATMLSGVRPGLKILYMSGYTDDAIVNHGILDGSANFIGKPFEREQLLRAVRQAIDAPARPA